MVSKWSHMLTYLVFYRITQTCLNQHNLVYTNILLFLIFWYFLFWCKCHFPPLVQLISVLLLKRLWISDVTAFICVISGAGLSLSRRPLSPLRHSWTMLTCCLHFYLLMAVPTEARVSCGAGSSTRPRCSVYTHGLKQFPRYRPGPATLTLSQYKFKFSS